MSVRGISLAKCLVVLFFYVTGSSNAVYKVLNDFAFLTIPDSWVQDTYDIKWYKNNFVIMKLKNTTITNYTGEKTYTLFKNATLKIHPLVKEDSGNYKVEVYDAGGQLQRERNFSLIIQDHVSKPKITWICSKKPVKVICEANQTDQAFIHLLQNNKTVHVNNKTDANGKLKTEFIYQSNTFPAKFQCEVKNEADKKTVEQEIRCPASTTNESICHNKTTCVISQESSKNTPQVSSRAGSLDIILILSTAVGAVFFVIFLALLIYCIRKKRAERYEEDEEERPMQSQKMSDELKYWDLPQVPAHAPQRQPCQQQRPAPQSHVQHQARRPQPRPRTQPKSPSHMKERQ